MSDRIEQAIEVGVDAIRQRFPGLDMAHLEFRVGLEAALAALVRCDCGIISSFIAEAVCPDHRPHVVLAEQPCKCETCTDGNHDPGCACDGTGSVGVVVLESWVEHLPSSIDSPPKAYFVARLDDDG